jgi:putative ABC transport system permease protein
MLGIIVGVLTVMLTLSLGAGARQAISDQISALGSNLVVVNSGPPPASGQEAVYLYPADAAAILRYCPSVAAVDAEQEERLTVTTGSAQLQDNFVMGVTSSYADIRRVKLTSGRFFSPDEDDHAAKVAVLGETVRQYLFGIDEALGRRVRIGGIDFRVIGVLTPRGDSPGLGPGMSTDDRVFIPLSALDKRMLGSTTLRLITISSRGADAIPLAAEETRTLLAKRHPNNPFEIRTQTELIQTSNSVSGIVNLLLTSLAGVSLAVGGIAIMDIILVAVSERTREIGVRRAVGADRASILSQFLLESIVLSLVGGMIGVVLAVATSAIAGLALRWHTPILPGSIAIALLSATMVGILSGIYPARQASGLNVVDALRFE